MACSRDELLPFCLHREVPSTACVVAGSNAVRVSVRSELARFPVPHDSDL
jgi:hypothetical protein